MNWFRPRRTPDRNENWWIEFLFWFILFVVLLQDAMNL